MKEIKKIKKVYVHSGIFHADDVTVVAIMRLLGVKNYERVSVAPEDREDIIIADIGFGEFDHHQTDAKKYPDGGKYAACGLIWKEFGHLLISDKDLCNAFRDKILRPIEKADNGEGSCSFSSVISSFLPLWNDEKQDYETGFSLAVDFMFHFLERELRMSYSIAQANKIIKRKINSQKNILVLDKFMPWQHSLINTHIDFIVFPSPRGGYQLQAVPINIHQFTPVKKQLPVRWIKEKPMGCRFVHTTCFMATFDKVENILKALEYEKLLK